MKAKSVLLGFSLISFLHCSAQEKENKSIVFNGVSLYLGSLSHQGNVGTISDFRKLAKGSELLETDLTGYDKNQLFHNQESNTIGGMNVHFRFINPEKVDQKVFTSLRLGFSVSDSRLLSTAYSKSDEFRLDTLVSSQSGKEYYVDSTVSRNLYIDYSQSQFFLSAAYLIGSNPDDRWSFYTGVGVMAGVAVDASTYISKSNNSYVENSRSNLDEWDRDYEYDYDDEYFTHKSSVSMMASVPIGIDFRVGKKSKFWKGSHLVLEYQPSLYYYSIPELNTSTVTTAGIWSFIYKFQFR
jgi:hypothetical protein